MCAYTIGCRPAVPEIIAEELELVESRLEAELCSEIRTANSIARHLANAGGKRVRPALVLMSAGACGGNVKDPRIIDLAVATELMHTASLVHDDVVDETHQRRGVPTANGKWGNRFSILGGDFLLARAFSLMATIAISDVSEALARAAVQMTESELLQAECEGSIDAWRTNYWRIIKGKTAAFTAACCECGAIMAEAVRGNPSRQHCGDSDGIGHPTPHRQALRDYGTNFGLAFQITDDLLDILGDPAETGKDVGSDLLHGKFTLPVLIASQHECNTSVKQSRLLEIIRRESLTPEKAREAAQIVIESGAVESSRSAALGYAEKAVAALTALPYSPFRSALSHYALSIAERAS